MILTLLNEGLSLAPFIALIVALGFVAVLHQRLFLAAFTFLTALENTRDFAPDLAITMSGLQIHPDDLVMVVAAVAAAPHLGRIRLDWGGRAAVLVCTMLVAFGLLNWSITYGIQLGVNSWRPQMLIVTLLLYTTTRPRAWSWDDLRYIIVAPAIVAALASLAGILLHGFGSSALHLEVDGVLEDSRPVLAPGSLLMLVGLWVTVLSVGRWNARRALTTLVLGTMVLLTQNRSVWVAAILGVVLWWVGPRIPRVGSGDALSGSSRTLLVFCGAAVTGISGIFVVALGQSASNGETWVWRVSRWTTSMGFSRSAAEWLFGSAFGSTPASTPTLFATSAHSLYVSNIEMTGFIGLAAILVLLFAAGRSGALPSTGPLGLILSITFLGYGFAYQVPPWAWMLVGVLLASQSADLICGQLTDNDGYDDLAAPDRLQDSHTQG